MSWTDNFDPLLLFTDLDAAVIGVADVWSVDGSRPQRVVYSAAKLIDMLTADGMSEEEAIEFIEVNIAGAYVGPGTPIVVWEVDTSDGDLAPPVPLTTSADAALKSVAPTVE